MEGEEEGQGWVGAATCRELHYEGRGHAQWAHLGEVKRVVSTVSLQMAREEREGWAKLGEGRGHTGGIHSREGRLGESAPVPTKGGCCCRVETRDWNFRV